MDDSFRGSVPVTGPLAGELPRLPDIPLNGAALAFLADSYFQAGKTLTLLSPFGDLLYHDTKAAEGRWDSLWPAESRPLIEGAVARARSGSSVAFELMAPALAPLDPLRWWRVSLTPLLAANGSEIVLLRAMCTDITGQMDQTYRKSRPDWVPGLSGGLQGRKTQDS